jgi:eukaryotic-like serine/threonine-protein kinase
MTLPARPAKLGRYDVIAKIAGGGLSTVYLGRKKDDGSAVALKIVRHDLRGDDEVLGMFRDEANLLPRLVHPGIVRTLEVGVGSETAFIAMELLLGVTLGHVLRTCATKGFGLHPDASAFIVARVADALHHAHELGVIHRDANPENVFLGFDGTVKLIDFGLAKAEGRLTRSMPGVVKGKLPYLAPEQIMQLPVDRRTDVFALATTFWEMLTMRRLFRRDTEEETLRAVHRGPIIDPCRLAPDVPAELGPIVLDALERNRDTRTPTARALAEQLDGFLRRRGAVDSRAAIAATMSELFAFEAKRQRGWSKPILTRSSRTRLASAG